jgi:hypothetical protein
LMRDRCGLMDGEFWPYLKAKRARKWTKQSAEIVAMPTGLQGNGALVK